ncbi:hypothetical protein GPECTOR_7g976 [Gonium pectorale]|uniref:RING-CH-type domain-containing protein n=1 Tax=Gonium pectorale TaxID=33097 RepID=A0A150GUH5_GONPE|nr:hypothetical protein GPECTOR_7g976 [Gonium pectorale]|eukprot:KXZ53526.1 hypothetical protein GPECTOR_7g976 [Gonium pectorale]
MDVTERSQDARERDQRPHSKWAGGTEVSCRGGPLSDTVPDNCCSDEQADVCWVCLDGPAPGRPLIRPCKCPRYCHGVCIARWQLQSAGSKKETHCEFCQSELPEWKETLTPSCGCQAPAVMNVCFGGRTYSFEVQPGPDGYRRFTNAIRAAFALPEDSELNITFTCDEPNSGETPNIGSLLTLQGAGAYDAAVHCASVSAARRISTGNPLAQAPVWPTGGGRSISGGGSASGSGGNKARLLGNLGRRLRNAMAELFSPSGGSGRA